MVRKITFLLCALAVLTYGNVVFGSAAANDTEYPALESVITILQPKYWVLKEYTHNALNGSETNGVFLYDQADQGSRTTRYVRVEESSRAGIFQVPEIVAGKLSNAQLINFFLYQNLRNSIGSKLIKAESVVVGGVTGYKITWSFRSTQHIAFGATDVFYFKDDSVYHVHGEYATNLGTDVRTRVEQIVASLKFLK